MAFFAHVCSEASLPKKAKGDLCFSRVYTANRMLRAAILALSIACERFPHLSQRCAFNILEFSRGYGGNTDPCCPSSEECLLIVLEMRSWTRCLSGMQGRGSGSKLMLLKRVEINTVEFGMLGKRSVPRLDDILKAFCSSSR